MSRRFLAIFISLLLLFSALSAWELNRQTDFPVHLYDLEQVGEDIWVGGMNGAFAKSSDNGETFEFVDSPAFDAESNYYKDVNGIAFGDQDNGVVVSENGLAFMTNDGATWQTIDFIADYFGNDHLEDAAYLPDGKIWAVGKNGKVAYSVDFGATWQSQESGTTATIYAVEMQENGTGYLVGNNGSNDVTWVRKTTDFGENWLDSGAVFMGAPHLYEVVSNNGKVIVSGEDGFIAVSEDGAATFQQITDTGATHHLRNIAMNGDLGFAVGWYGELVKTTDNWATTTFVENNFSSYFDGVAFTQDDQIVICGWYGTVAKSDYEAEVWIEKTVPAYYLYGGDILDAENWYFAGDRSTLIRTEDAGATYQKIDVTSEVEDFYAVCFFNSDVGVVASEEDGKLYRTTTAGASWDEVNLAMGEISYILKVDQQTAYIMGEDNIFYSEDQGESWQDMSAPYTLYGANSKPGGDIFFVGESGQVVIKSTDEWSAFNLGSDNLYGVAFSSDQVGVITTSEGNIYYTENGGETLADWQQANYDGTDQLFGVNTNLAGDFVAVGYANNAGNQGVENAIIVSQDNGVNWEMIEIDQPPFIPTRLKNILAYQGRLVAFGAYQLVYTHYDASYGTLAGTVSLSGGEGNVEDVALSIAGETYFPAADGSYQIELETGTYQLSANLAGYDALLVENIEILADEVTDLDLDLSPTTYYGYLSGTVNLEDGAGDVSQVNLEIAEENISPDAAGEFWLELEVGSYQLIASLEGYVTETITDILIEAEATTELPITLVAAQSSSDDLVLTTKLLGNYPNPFNASNNIRTLGTNIKFSLQTAEVAKLTIYNARGQVVLQEKRAYEAGKHSYSWDATEQSSGIYFYRLQTSNYDQVMKMILLK